ncbi:MAG: type II toxin-antitoxin system RatA family toxin [Rhodospirillaceae bacterium]|jgi:coenzyme Q-binding protein COQ10|nr:type II toxin-antitoxin system RatA family toxin [Rhodospirillaceae bacterium]
MPMHAEKRVLPYSPEQMFELVRDVEKYPDFLPWCYALRVRKREINEAGEEVLLSDMAIGFKVFRERFTTRVVSVPAGPDGASPRIDVSYTNGPFKFLNNHWIFNPGTQADETEIDFFVDFEFRSKILDKAIGMVFNEAVYKMVNAFETRAAAVYGSKG